MGHGFGSKILGLVKQWYSTDNEEDTVLMYSYLTFAPSLRNRTPSSEILKL